MPSLCYLRCLNLTSMKETSPDGPYIDRLRSWASSKVHGGNSSTARRPGHLSDPDLLPISSDLTNDTTNTLTTTTSSHDGRVSSSPERHRSQPLPAQNRGPGGAVNLQQKAGPHNGPGGGSQSSASPQASRKGSQLGTEPPAENNEKTEDQDGQDKKERPNVVKRFFTTARKILCHSWLNVLLVFVPVGIAVECIPGMSPGVIFAMNAIAIIPLAGLLSQATETVAHRMGDAIGALLNITFGNAVELIILYVRARPSRRVRRPGRG